MAVCVKSWWHHECLDGLNSDICGTNATGHTCNDIKGWFEGDYEE